MAYYLLTKDNEGNHKALNIASSSIFKSECKFKKPKAHTLQEIDYFTSEFEDEQELKEHLISEGILSKELILNPLSIRFIKENNYDGIKYDLLYQDSVEYIMEIERLISLILKRYYANDFEFIKRLARRFSNFRECQSTAPELVGLSELSIQLGRRDNGFNEVDSNGDNAVTRLVKLLILKHHEKPNGQIEYKNKYNYRNLHLLVSFILNYDKEIAEEEQIELPSPKAQISKEIPKESIHYESKEYTRKRKINSQLTGQMKFKI